MTLNEVFPEKGFCPSCNARVSQGRQTCETCGAVLPMEAALQGLMVTARNKASSVLQAARRHPLFWAGWGLAVVPFFVVPPLLAIALNLFVQPRDDRNAILLTVAMVNVVLSICFWLAVGEYISASLSELADWFRALSIPASSGFIQV